ncbi:MAG: c-type cytochrome [Rhodomicrobiaceae bacterium]
MIIFYEDNHEKRWRAHMLNCYWLKRAGGGAAFLLAVTFQPAHAVDDAVIELGKQVFTELAEPNCGICHALKDAGTEGEVGPPLDEARPDAKKVETAVRGGVGVMPAYENLSDEEIEAVSQYVASVTGEAD